MRKGYDFILSVPKSIEYVFACSKQPPVTTPLDIESTAGILRNRTVSAGSGDTATVQENFLQLSMMELVRSLTGKQRFKRGNNRNKARKVLTLNLAGKLLFFAGQRFSGLVTWGCLNSSS